MSVDIDVDPESGQKRIRTKRMQRLTSSAMPKEKADSKSSKQQKEKDKDKDREAQQASQPKSIGIDPVELRRLLEAYVEKAGPQVLRDYDDRTSTSTDGRRGNSGDMVDGDGEDEWDLTGVCDDGFDVRRRNKNRQTAYFVKGEIAKKLHHSQSVDNLRGGSVGIGDSGIGIDKEKGETPGTGGRDSPPPPTRRENAKFNSCFIPAEDSNKHMQIPEFDFTKNDCSFKNDLFSSFMIIEEEEEEEDGENVKRGDEKKDEKYWPLRVDVDGPEENGEKQEQYGAWPLPLRLTPTESKQGSTWPLLQTEPSHSGSQTSTLITESHRKGFKSHLGHEDHDEGPNGTRITDHRKTINSNLGIDELLDELSHDEGEVNGKGTSIKDRDSRKSRLTIKSFSTSGSRSNGPSPIKSRRKSIVQILASKSVPKFAIFGEEKENSDSVPEVPPIPAMSEKRQRNVLKKKSSMPLLSSRQISRVQSNRQSQEDLSFGRDTPLPESRSVKKWYSLRRKGRGGGGDDASVDLNLNVFDEPVPKTLKKKSSLATLFNR